VARRARLAKLGKLRAPVDVQGIVSGELQQSLKYTVTQQLQLVLKYDSPHANYFTHERNLLPSGFNAEWRRTCDGIIQNHLDVEYGVKRKYARSIKRDTKYRQQRARTY
jgi:hypothetical protein